MKVRLVGFGSLEVEGRRFDHDVVVDGETVRSRDKKPSKRYRSRYGHTPLSVDEDLPWDGEKLIIGTGVDGALPVMPEVLEEGARRGIEVVVLPTAQACRLLDGLGRREARAVLHVTC